MGKCYICKNEGKHMHIIAGEEFVFCNKCQKAYRVCTKALKRAKKGLYLVKGGK